MPILAYADKSYINWSGGQSVTYFVDYFLRIAFSVEQMIRFDAGWSDQSLEKVLAKAGGVFEGQAYVFVEVKHLDLMPVYSGSFGQRVEEFKLRGARRGDYAGSPLLCYCLANGVDCL